MFLSYARRDGQYAADRLRSLLEDPTYTANVPLSVWQDLTSMRSGDWREQIRAAIEPGGHVLAIVTPGSLYESEVCAWEWSTARIKGAEISPILVNTALKREDLPKWMRANYIYRLDLDASDLDETDEWKRLVASLGARPSDNVSRGRGCAACRRV